MGKREQPESFRTMYTTEITASSEHLLDQMFNMTHTDQLIQF